MPIKKEEKSVTEGRKCKVDGGQQEGSGGVAGG